MYMLIRNALMNILQQCLSVCDVASMDAFAFQIPILVLFSRLQNPNRIPTKQSKFLSETFFSLLSLSCWLALRLWRRDYLKGRFIFSFEILFMIFIFAILLVKFLFLPALFWIFV